MSKVPKADMLKAKSKFVLVVLIISEAEIQMKGILIVTLIKLATRIYHWTRHPNIKRTIYWIPVSAPANNKREVDRKIHKCPATSTRVFVRQSVARKETCGETTSCLAEKKRSIGEMLGLLS